MASNNTNISSDSSVGLLKWSPWAKTTVLVDPPGDSRGESVSSPFPSRNSLQSLASGPFLHLQSQQHQTEPFSCCNPLTFTLLPLSRGLCDTVDPNE